MHVDTIMESRDATFFENMFPMKDMHSFAEYSSELIPESSTSNDYFEQTPVDVIENIAIEKDDNEAPARSKRRRVQKSFGDDFIVYLVDDTPTSIAEAYASPDADDWKEAVHNEMDSILSNGTWELSERPYGCKPVGCKWVFKKKLRPDGTTEKYNARVVAKGLHLEKTKIILHQMYFKATFLNKDLEEKIYM